MENILTYKKFRSAFTRPQQRKDFLFRCARDGFRAIKSAWPDANIRLFVFGSTIKTPINIGADSDLDLAVSGLDHIAPNTHQRSALIRDEFRKGLTPENQTLPFDILTFNADNPETMFAKEILRDGIEIRLE